MHNSHLAQWLSGPPVFRVGHRRWFLEVGAAGLLGVPMLRSVALASDAAEKSSQRKAVILIWLSGGPSHIDMWDPKPDAPSEVRGPYKTIATKISGVRFSEHLPMQASIADQLSIIRSVDCRASNHTPITMQACNPLARRTDDGKDGDGYPSMGSIAAKFRGPNQPDMPPFVGLADSWKADVWESGHMGKAFAPINGKDMLGKFGLPDGMSVRRLQDRESLRSELSRLGRQIDLSETSSSIEFDRNAQRAHEMILSGKVAKAFRLEDESDSMRDAYGRSSLGEKTLLARRLVESGVTFVLVSGAWGYFDHHGDNVKWGGIEKGLTPLLPQVDRALHALVTDLTQRGLIDSTMVMMMGEFGRSPKINAEAGRDHWTNVMSMVVAGGGLRHGQVIGSTDRHGGEIASNSVRPQDLAATTFRHLGIDLNASWVNGQGRPVPIVCEGGRPIPEFYST
jgi:uncharacterized protein (DUF1501 family)